MDRWVVVVFIQETPEAIYRLDLRDHPSANHKDVACADSSTPGTPAGRTDRAGFADLKCV